MKTATQPPTGARAEPSPLPDDLDMSAILAKMKKEEEAKQNLMETLRVRGFVFSRGALRMGGWVGGETETSWVLVVDRWLAQHATTTTSLCVCWAWGVAPQKQTKQEADRRNGAHLDVLALLLFVRCPRGGLQKQGFDTSRMNMGGFDANSFGDAMRQANQNKRGRQQRRRSKSKKKGGKKRKRRQEQREEDEPVDEHIEL